jgi:hypothetical protein
MLGALWEVPGLLLVFVWVRCCWVVVIRLWSRFGKDWVDVPFRMAGPQRVGQL